MAVIALSVVVPSLTFSAAASASDFTNTQTPSTTTVTPGTNVTFTVMMRNASADSNSLALDANLPANWSVVAQNSSPNARFQSANVQWLWFAPGSPESTTFTVNYTVQVPSSASDGVYSIDANGNFNNGTAFWSNTTSTVRINTEPPTISNATAADADGDGSVTDGDSVAVSANVTDAGADVDTVMANASAFGAGTMMLTDGDNDSVYNGTFTVNASMAAMDGSYPVIIEANDTAGIAGEARTNNLTLDTAGPEIENATAMGPGGSHNVTDGDAVTVSAEVTDAGAGVDTVMANASMFGGGHVMLTDGDGDGTYDGTFTVNASMAAMDGSYPVMVTANDTLGNENMTATNNLTLDTTGPMIRNATAIDAEDGDGAVTGGDNVTVSANVTDVGSGVDTVMANATAFGAGDVMLTDGDGDGIYDTTFAVNANMAAANGSYPVGITASDALGNENRNATNRLQLNTSEGGDGDRDVRTVAPGQPGFGAVLAVLALLAAALFALRRRD